MLLGTRVVCGRDWKARATNDKDERYGVGTIVDIRDYQDGKPLPKETVLVFWDTGEHTCCRAGQDGCYDLRVLDSAPAGVTFEDRTCGGCQQSGIAGMRWHCVECSNYDLCTECYMKDVHDIRHRFLRFSSPGDRYSGVDVGRRSTSFKIPSKGIFPGAKVRTRREMKSSWTSPVLIGGEVLDVITWDDIPRCAVKVKWGDVSEQVLRLGYKGKVDLELVEFANGPSYYPNHLPLVSIDGHIRLINRIISCDKNITDEEVMQEGENAINYLNDLQSTCDLEGKAMVSRIKREIQELQHAVEFGREKFKTIRRLTLSSDDSLGDTKDSQTISMPIGMPLDTTDGSDRLDNESKLPYFGQKTETETGKEPKDHEAKDMRLSVSEIRRKFERMTSSIKPNLATSNQISMPLVPKIANQVPTTVLPSEDNQHVTSINSACLSEEKPKQKNTECEDKSENVCDRKKYVSSLVLKFEALTTLK